MPAPDVAGWPGLAVVGSDDRRLGTVDRAYADRETGTPTFVSVDTGTTGERPRLVPVAGASREGDVVRLPHAWAAVDGSPDVHDEARLDPAEEQRLYDHFGVPRPDLRGGGPPPAADGDAAMTRSEEELDVERRVVPAGRVRLVKHVVTEEVTTTVSVSREEVRLEREPIVLGVVDVPGDPGAAAAVPDALAPDVHEIVLHAEEVVVTKRVVPRERVRLVTDVVAGEVDVRESLRRERIDVEPAAPEGAA